MPVKGCGALMQLVANGAKDVYLTGNPNNGLPIYGYSTGTLSQNTPTSSLEFVWLNGSYGDARYNSKAKIDYKDFFKSVNHEEFLLKKSDFDLVYQPFTDIKFLDELDGEPIETNVEHYKKGSGNNLVIPSYSELLLNQ